MEKKETVWLYVSGSKYASRYFEQNFDKKEIYDEMIKNNTYRKTIETEGVTIDIEIFNFGEVDSSFESFMKNNLCDCDIFEHENIYRVELEYEEDNDNDDEIYKELTENMELGNLFFGNSRGKYPMERGIWQSTFAEFLEEIGLDSYGYVENKKLQLYKTSRGGFENEVFIVNPYYWGDDEETMEEHNFIYKPTDYTIDWYKYPLRDSYANKKLTFKEFEDILEECKKSIEK